jgi:hypothetical protein
MSYYQGAAETSPFGVHSACDFIDSYISSRLARVTRLDLADVEQELERVLEFSHSCGIVGIVSLVCDVRHLDAMESWVAVTRQQHCVSFGGDGGGGGGQEASLVGSIFCSAVNIFR